ncbi:putative membrane protein [Clostridium bornimense]|uniref:Putative membrane protein n=1 Tax=Clostridium bornimense TaxID=1216932 RepID=W6S0J1_9CLOT|nr:ABC transporter permease [Clostridium bornimense]CDM70406.1 putative membrane protein [Clostridium bornimense]
MKTFYYVKSTLKSMVSSGAVVLSYFIIFPIIMACFMGYFNNLTNENPLKLSVLDVKVVDNDSSEMSKKLVEIIKGKDLKELIKVTDKDSDVELVIDKGYEDNILNKNKGSITINRKTEEKEVATNTLKTILDRYHQNLYISLSNGNVEDLDKFFDTQIIDNIKIDTMKTNNMYEKYAASMIGFVIVMLIMIMAQGAYNDKSVNIENRVNVAPVTKIQYLFYDTLAHIIYVFIIITAYVIFFRVTGLSFKGNILDLLVLVSTSTLLVVFLCQTIITVFKAKYGKIISYIIFFIPVASTEMFSLKGNKLTIISPTHYLNNAFTLYNLNGNLSGGWKWIFMILAIAIIIYSLAIIKAIISGRRKLCN